MTAPTDPMGKKEAKDEKTDLTIEERVGRLEIVLENAFNLLSKNIQETEMRMAESRRYLETDLARSLHMMNLTTLQNIITIREVTTMLIGKEVIDGKELESKIETSLREALEAQSKAIEEAQANAEAAQAQEAPQA